ncbi:hypothetical protein DL98DRAFT_224301 [Cadophora sp. DSE1049]|nr:hypothetical protein DL98DRAFT_224301 [Cadophora sp. DSE1049]
MMMNDSDSEVQLQNKPDRRQRSVFSPPSHSRTRTSYPSLFSSQLLFTAELPCLFLLPSHPILPQFPSSTFPSRIQIPAQTALVPIPIKIHGSTRTIHAKCPCLAHVHVFHPCPFKSSFPFFFRFSVSYASGRHPRVLIGRRGPSFWAADRKCLHKIMHWPESRTDFCSSNLFGWVWLLVGHPSISHSSVRTFLLTVQLEHWFLRWVESLE